MPETVNRNYWKILRERKRDIIIQAIYQVIKLMFH